MVRSRPPVSARRLAASLLIALVIGLPGRPPEASPPLRVLFIGNSYTYVNDMPATLRKLATAEARPVETKTIGAPAATLQRHWDKGEARDVIRQGPWDFVVLQEQSVLPTVDPDTMFRYVRLFDAEIKNVNARTVLYLTWAREDRPAMQAALDTAYGWIARELDAMVAPVGPAWQRVRAGTTRVTLYQIDHSHPTPAGSYAAACVFYSVLFGKPAGAPASGDSPEAEAVRRAAWEAVREFR